MAAQSKVEELWTTSAEIVELWGEPATPPAGSEGGGFYHLQMMQELNNPS